MEGSATPIVEPESKFGSNVEGTETPIVEAESKFGSTVEGSETPAVEPEPKDGSTVEASENDNPIVEAASKDGSTLVVNAYRIKVGGDDSTPISKFLLIDVDSMCLHLPFVRVVSTVEGVDATRIAEGGDDSTPISKFLLIIRAIGDYDFSNVSLSSPSIPRLPAPYLVFMEEFLKPYAKARRTKDRTLVAALTACGKKWTFMSKTDQEPFRLESAKRMDVYQKHRAVFDRLFYPMQPPSDGEFDDEPGQQIMSPFGIFVEYEVFLAGTRLTSFNGSFGKWNSMSAEDKAPFVTLSNDRMRVHQLVSIAFFAHLLDKYRDVNYHESSSDGSSEETEYFRPTNGLLVYLEEFLSEYEKDKKVLKKSSTLVFEELVQEWDMMTEEQRCPYHDKAKKLMNICRNPNSFGRGDCRNPNMPRNRLRLPCLRLDEWAAFTLEKLNRSKGSNFLADCLVELRDQNASKDFILLLEELLPYAQSVESYKRSSEFIFLKLVSELQMEARFSLDSILSLIAALSGDLKYDFAPTGYLPEELGIEGANKTLKRFSAVIMATPADSRAVKSLNNSQGTNKFVFKKVGEKMEDTKTEVVNVFKSLEKVKAEPSQGSTFLKDRLVELRELNTTEHFTKFYEEMFPFVQTLPLVISQKEIVFSKLVSGLHMEARLSLGAFLELIDDLSRDLLDSFIPFLPRLVNSLVTLLKKGGQKEPDIVKQIFVSWSNIVMNLQKYLICDIERVLRDTLELRYYPQESINELMSRSMALLLRTARDEQREIGIKRIISELADPLKKCGGAGLLYHVMIRDASEKSLHSKAGKALSFLLKDSTLSSCDDFPQGSGSTVEAVSSALQRICEATNAEELTVLWDCLFKETKESIKNKNSAHLTRLLTLLTSAVRVGKGLKACDYRYLVGLVSQIVPTFMDSSDVLSRFLGLMLCTIDIPSDVNELESIASQWTPIFSLKSLSCINNMITESSEEVIPLLLSLCKKQQTSHDKVDIVYGSFESIQVFLEDKIKKIQINIENTGLAQIDEAELAAVWGAVNCFPYFKLDSSLLIRFKNTLKQQLAASAVSGSSAQELMWQSLLGSALRSCLKIRSTGRLIHSDVEEVLSLAKCYKSCVQVLSPVADYLDFVYRPQLANDDISKPCPELQANNAEDAFDIFCENLRHPNKDVRLMTLRILCHFEPLSPDPCVEEHPPPMKKLKTEVVQKSPSKKNDVTTNVLQILKTVGESRPTLRSKKDLDAVRHLADDRIHDAYVPLVFNGMIGLFHTNNESTEIWEPASKCLADLMMKHTSALWNGFVHYLGHCQLKIEALHIHRGNGNYSVSQKHTGLMESFNAFISPRFNGTPTADVVSLLLKTLQKVPSVAQSHTSDILPLLLKFMGYKTENPLRVGLYNSEACKGKEWKGLLEQSLALLKLMKNPRSSRVSQFVNDVMQYRFLDDNDAEIQMSVLECLVLSNDYLLPHRHRLENLIKSKKLREELTNWNFS
ncbi:unnamed protein product [Brassica rapa]|uniref:U3 small nucleolar RNA-associated protein 20 N-terminal domain-containing protein n=1 Tax=Brassica campestris TaxID=3711 RepID=A0A8D9CTY7_BRACM|nr:unnamed protein product [Brassica rapa]